MNPTLTAPQVAAYIASHMGGPPDGLAAPLRPDFGAPDAPPEDDVNRQAIIERAQAIRESVRYVQSIRPTSGMTKAAILARVEQVWSQELGPFDDHAREIAELAAEEAGEPPPPPPTQYDSFGGSYGAGEHGMAFDWYPAGEDGPHFGYQFRCPAAGVVTRYSFGPGPLGIQCLIDKGGGQVVTLEMATTADTVQRLLTPAQIDAIISLGTFMHIAVEAFDTPQRTPGGHTARAIWLGHVAPDFAMGRRAAGDVLAVCSNSGIEFPGVDAAHGHVCGTATGQLSPNGDIPGLEVVRLLGGRPRVTVVPGPQDYASGQYDRGKRRT